MKKKEKRTNRMFNDTLARALNKHYGFPEDYTGRIEGFENTVPVACKVFGSDHVEEITKE